jgi:hypothetical protein
MVPAQPRRPFVRLHNPQRRVQTVGEGAEVNMFVNGYSQFEVRTGTEGAWDSLALWNPSLCFSSWLGTRTH